MCKFEIERFDFLDGAQPLDSAPFDVLITVIGYEARGRHLLESGAAAHYERIYAYRYGHNRVGAYEANLAFFCGMQASVLDVAEDEYAQDLNGRLYRLADELLADDTRPLRIAVDISCMDRDRLGRTVRCILELRGFAIQVGFAYSVGAYDRRLVGSEGQVRVNRAVAGFQGWTEDPTLPVVAFIGCGVESRLALAAVETLEPSEVLWLVPRGEDLAYDSLIAERNATLFQDASTEPYFYDVMDPYVTITELEASVSAIRANWRVVLVPLGPKIFALSCLLVAMLFDTNVSVWRLSADDQRVPEDRLPSGSIVGLMLRRAVI